MVGLLVVVGLVVVSNGGADEPEIEVDKAWVHGGLGYEAVLSCLVTIINHDRYKEDHFKTTGLW